MKSSRSRPAEFSGRGFTLAEVLAAMLVLAIVIPVALQGLTVASRAGLVGTRKAAAMHVAERVLNEQFVTGQLSQSRASGSITEDDVTYPWTLETSTWPQDTMTKVTVHVEFTVQGTQYEVSASTLVSATSSTSSTTTAATQ